MLTSIILMVAVTVGERRKNIRYRERIQRERDESRERLNRQYSMRETPRVGQMWMGDGYVQVENFSNVPIPPSNPSAVIDETMSELERVCKEYEDSNPDPKEEMEQPIEPPEDFMLFDMENKEI
jgi:hypothetical protein